MKDRYKKVALFGIGTIGAGLAAYFALKGIEVYVYARSDRGKARLAAVIDTYRNLGIIDENTDLAALVHFSADPKEVFSDVYFVQESATEDIEEKRVNIALMEEYLPAEAIIASSSSGIPVTVMAEGAKHPERIIVAHPFNPAYLLPLMELCGGEQTTQEVLDEAVEFYKACGKVPVVMKKEKAGFIANRLAHAVWREEVAMVAEGVCTLEDADNALCFGPGLRWAAFGPAMNYELGGSEDGLKGIIEKFGSTSDRIFADLSNMAKTPDGFANTAGEQMPEYIEKLPEHVGHTRGDIAAFRDGLIVELLKMHNKF